MDLERQYDGNYYYLSREDSVLYHQVKDSEDEKDKVIKKLLEDKSAACRRDHCALRY
jgi:hypothetical protein